MFSFSSFNQIFSALTCKHSDKVIKNEWVNCSFAHKFVQFMQFLKKYVLISKLCDLVQFEANCSAKLYNHMISEAVIIHKTISLLIAISLAYGNHTGVTQ